MNNGMCNRVGPSLTELTVAFGALFHHVDHMADFNRLTVDVDELGFSLVQSYLYHETARVQPLLQESIDIYTEVLGNCPRSQRRDDSESAKPVCV